MNKEKDILDMIVKSKTINEIFFSVSSDDYSKLANSKKIDLYITFINELNRIFNSDISLNFNKHYSQEYNRVEYSPSNNEIILNGLDDNPYLYLKDIFLGAFYLNFNNDNQLNIGSASYGKSSVFESVLYQYSKENYQIHQIVNYIMSELLTGINNHYVKAYHKDFDNVITQEAIEDLAKLNYLIEEHNGEHIYDKFVNIVTIYKNIKNKRKLLKEDAALLALDSVIEEFKIDMEKGYNKKSFNLKINEFLDYYFPEYAPFISSDELMKKYFDINKSHYFTPFIDLLMQEIEKIDKDIKFSDRLIDDNVLINFNKKANVNYNKLEYYLFDRLEELDKFLLHRNLELVGYIQFATCFSKKENEDYLDNDLIINNLITDEFKDLCQSYLNDKKNNHEKLQLIFDYLKESYFNNDEIKLNLIHEKLAYTSLGEQNKKDLTLYLSNIDNKEVVLATLFHEFRHCIQYCEVNSKNHHLYSPSFYKALKANFYENKFSDAIGYCDTSMSGYANFNSYEFQPCEYDAETFSFKLCNKLNCFKSNLDSVFIDIINTKYINPLKYSIRVLMNHIKINKVVNSARNDNLLYKNLIDNINNCNDYRDAIEVFKQENFFSLPLDKKEKIYKLISKGEVEIICEKDFISIGDKLIKYSSDNSDTSNNDYLILEAILNKQAKNLVKNGKLNNKDINDYIYKKSRLYKPKMLRINDAQIFYYYHLVFDKYSKNNNLNHKKSHVR